MYLNITNTGTIIHKTIKVNVPLNNLSVEIPQVIFVLREPEQLILYHDICVYNLKYVILNSLFQCDLGIILKKVLVCLFKKKKKDV